MYADGQVRFEADRLDQAHRKSWSVLVQGHAHTVTDEREVKRLEGRTHLEPWADGARDVYVRITPTRISGDASSRTGPARWRQTPEPRPSALSQWRQDETTDDITLSEIEDNPHIPADLARATLSRAGWPARAD